METDTSYEEGKQVNLGRNARRLREIIGMKQGTLAANTGYSQQYISKLEQSETLEDDILEKLANGLGVTPELIRNFNEEKAVYNIQNNYDTSTNHQNYQPTIYNHPIDKVAELFEKLLESEKGKTALLDNVNKAIIELRNEINALKYSSK